MQKNIALWGYYRNTAFQEGESDNRTPHIQVKKFFFIQQSYERDVGK